MDTRKLFAEAVGTFILVGVGSMTIIAALASQLPPELIAPFGFGLGLLAAIAVGGHVSGGHFNPAVTLGAVLDRRIEIVPAIGYVIAQLVGAIAASATFLAFGLGRDVVSRTRNTPGPIVEDLGAFVAEVVLTAIFLAVILTVTRRAPGSAIFVIPLTLLVIHFAGIPISGASVNPARSLGPALVAGDFSKIWIYLTAPFVGSAIGWGVYKLLDDEEELGGEEQEELVDPFADEEAELDDEEVAS